MDVTDRENGGSRASAIQLAALRRFRRSMDVTFAQLAKVSGRSPAWLCEAERGFKSMTRSEVRRLRQLIEEIAMSKGRGL